MEEGIVREGFRGPDLEILGTGSWTLGGRVESNQVWVEGPALVASAYGPCQEGAGTRVCGHVNKEE